MAIDFPAGSSANSPFTASNGTVYEWNDLGYWEATSGPADIIISSLNGGQLAGFRNFIINGDLRINQRPYPAGGYVSDGGDLYISDRFATNAGTGAVTFTRQTAAQANANWANNRFGLNDFLTASVDGETVVTTIELPSAGVSQFKQGVQYTFSYYGTAGNTPQVAFRWSTAVSSGISGIIANWGAVTETATGINGLSRYHRTFEWTNANLANTDTCVHITWTSAGSQSGFQLEEGPVATPFEHRPIGTELALCQRYYQVIGEVVTSMPGAAVGNDLLYTCPYTTSMRAIPTASFNAKYGTVDTVIATLDSFILANGASDGTNRYGVDGLTFDAEF